MGENLNNCFKVKIDTSEKVLELRTLIWNKKLKDLTVDIPSRLKLWKVNISQQDEEKREILRDQDRYTNALEGTELLRDDNIAKHWNSTGSKQPKENHIHIIIKG